MSDLEQRVSILEDRVGALEVTDSPAVAQPVSQFKLIEFWGNTTRELPVPYSPDNNRRLDKPYTGNPEYVTLAQVRLTCTGSDAVLETSAEGEGDPRIDGDKGVLIAGDPAGTVLRLQAKPPSGNNRIFPNFRILANGELILDLTCDYSAYQFKIG